MSSLPLRLYQPDLETTSDLYERVVLPQLMELNRSPATLRDYRSHLARWKSFWEAQEPPGDPLTPKDLESTRISNPRVQGQIAEPLACELTRENLLAFRRWLPTVLGGDKSPRNLNKHVGTIQAILAAAAAAARKPLVVVLEDRLRLAQQTVAHILGTLLSCRQTPVNP